ncbi:hypothetical protein [Paenibacillus bovis]|uniref:Uncharacterized protein n=1 Tax=Paenibacillus bovis TaxID=1616788 RepID=A0A172ZFY2_9BACL|nr:hypothetical protein [Paenibacillus bovis]ANF96413.1 hypothetical protein AR543_10620 [Paenibacillus bovis]
MKWKLLMKKSTIAMWLIVYSLVISAFTSLLPTVAASGIDQPTKERIEQQYGLDLSRQNNLEKDSLSFGNPAGDWGYSSIGNDEPINWLRLGWVLWTFIQ